MKVEIVLKKDRRFQDYDFKYINEISLELGTCVVPYLNNVNAYPVLGTVKSVSNEDGKVYADIDFVKKPILIRKPIIDNFSWFPYNGKIFIVCLGLPQWFNFNLFNQLSSL